MPEPSTLVQAFRKPRPILPRLVQDRSGTTAITVAVSLVALLGFGALGVDLSQWYSTKRSMQTAVDAAAIAAAYELQRAGWTAASVQAAAETDAAAHGFGSGSGATLIANVIGGRRVEATLSQDGRMALAGLFLSAAPRLNTAAAAALPQTPPCLTILDPTGDHALHLNGSSAINAPGCRIQINSAHPDAIHGTGGAALITAEKVCVVGGAVHAPSVVGQLETGCKPLADPLGDWEPPTAPANCAPPAKPLRSDVTYCNGQLTFSGIEVIPPGVYHLRNTTLKFNSNAVVTGAGVAFLLMGNSRVEIGSGARVALTAPSSGPMAGIVFAHDRDAPAGIVHQFDGVGMLTYEGAIYLPKQDVHYTGTSSSANVPPFTTYIVRRLQLLGTGDLAIANNYAASEVPIVGMANTGVRLVD